ncbi:hypothetical protein DH2020_047268 [Rehmannia glutinosa]|uniref:Uncharacterized protein n=1 Tax=Rehmannia glutinosa TaxID=99300 RepID=A0ABR0U980_REHGL
MSRPVIDEDDVRLLIRVNTEKFLSAPLCLVTKLRDNQVSTQSKKEQNESESSNRFAEVVAPIGTVVPETQPQFIPVIPEHRVGHEAAVEPPRVACQQGTNINLNNDPHPDDDENVEHFYDYELEAELEETDPFFFDDLDGTFFRWSGPNGEKAPVASTEARPVNVVPAAQENDLSPPLNETAVDLGYEGGPSQFDHCTRKPLKNSVGTGHSCVGSEATTLDTTSNSISIDNDLHVNQMFQSKHEIIRRLQIISMMKKQRIQDKEIRSRFVSLPYALMINANGDYVQAN